MAQASTLPDPCNTPSPDNTEASCWTSLQMGNFFSDWTKNSTSANPPLIGLIYCRPREIWAQCFLRFAYGYQLKLSAPMDCSAFNSTSCRGPARVIEPKPTSNKFWYGAQAISSLYPRNTTNTSSCPETNRAPAVYLYIKHLSSALLSTTAVPGVLQSAYNNASTSVAFPNSPADATLIQLLTASAKTPQDNAFVAYMTANPFVGNFTGGAENAPPDDEVVYWNLIAMLAERVEQLMHGWDAFEQVTVFEGAGEAWMVDAEVAGAFVRRWTRESLGQQLEQQLDGLDDLTEGGSLETLIEDLTARGR
ncbi:MAG: hypothetical protein Q9197_005153 [Variospora fuerteventurae]